MDGYVFDTNVFNDILDEKVDISIFSRLTLFVTHIQHDELMHTKDEIRRDQLLSIFSQLDPSVGPTESFIIGYSRLGGAKLGDGTIYLKILSQLDGLKKKPNNRCDALIGEAALKNHLILVTKDNNLFMVMEKMGCSVLKLDELLDILAV